VKGHAGNRFNERADALASEEIARRTGTAAGIVGGGSAFLADSDQIPAATTLTLAVRFSGGRGSWCASVAGAAETETLIQGAPRATSSANRLELDAGVHLLEILDSWPDPVEIRCGDYLRRGATEWLAKWRAAGWRTAAGDEVKNSDLWQRLEPLLESHRSAQREVRFAKIDSKSPEVKELKKALR
jgi:ribonuclease HI